MRGWEIVFLEKGLLGSVMTWAAFLFSKEGKVMKNNLIVFTLAIFLTSLAIAQTSWYVDDNTCPSVGSGTEIDPYCNMQDAINISINGDTVLVNSGNYIENINFQGKAITVISVSGPEATTISGGGSVVVFNSGEGTDSILVLFHSEWVS